MTRDPLGASGDFVTAPEISQMFGELIGLWAAAVWRQMGAPENVRLVELGPGRGTMMLDALRAAQVVPDFRAAIVVHLVEISPTLQQRQQQALLGVDVPVHLARSARARCRTARDHPRQRILRRAAGPPGGHVRDGWHERVVEIDRRRQLRFGMRRDPIPLFDQLLPPRAARCADRRDLRMARRPIALEHRPARRAQRRRRADHRLRPRARAPPATRCRRSASTPSPIRWPRPARSTSPRMSISRRWRTPPRASARACIGPIEQGDSCAASASRPAPQR